MAIFAAPLELIMEEEMDMLSIASHVVNQMLIQVTIIQNSVARIVLLYLFQNVLQVIQISVVTYVDTMEVAQGHICMEEAPHATRLFITE